MPPGRELARGRELEPLRSCDDWAGRLSRLDEKVLDSDDGMMEKRREDLGFSPLLALFFREKPKEVRRLDSMLVLGPVVALTLSFDMGPAMEVGG